MLTQGRSAVAAGIASLLLAGTAYAADEPKTGAGNCDDVWFCVDVTVPGTGEGGGGQAGGQGASGGTSGAGSAGPKPDRDCGNRKLDPQPPAGSEMWEGHKPGDGAVYVNPCAESGAGSIAPDVVGLVFWSQNQPQAVNSAVLAQQALDKMLLRGPQIGITPKPGGKGVVGMPVYMWTARGAETYGPNTASASAGGVTVTATAKVTRIVWQMGDGKTVTCITAGTPYKAEFGKKPSPDCGHRYTQPSSTQESGKYHVTATSTWTIDWTGGGQSGQLTEIRDSDVDITVAEVQVLN